MPNTPSLFNRRSLVISSNAFSGTLPAWLGSLAAVQYLELSNNSWSGELPASLSALFDSVKSLAIANASLTGTIPQYLDTFVGLQELDLSHNALTGTVPNIFGGAVNVKCVRVSRLLPRVSVCQNTHLVCLHVLRSLSTRWW
jgi:hypothetical protein